MTNNLSGGKSLLMGLMLPMSSTYAIDPFAMKRLRKTSPVRVLFTLKSRLLDLIARMTYRHGPPQFRKGTCVTYEERGRERPDTAVTDVQDDLLMRALAHVGTLSGNVAEIGCYRGVTTARLASQTAKTVFAIDPFIGYGGSELDYEKFLDRVGNLDNVKHLRQTSGSAASCFSSSDLSLVFVDAVHDVVNSWFDLCTWSEKVQEGGLIAMHDVDDHTGVRFSVGRFLKSQKDFTVWGVCPNLIVIEKRNL